MGQRGRAQSNSGSSWPGCAEGRGAQRAAARVLPTLASLQNYRFAGWGGVVGAHLDTCRFKMRPNHCQQKYGFHTVRPCRSPAARVPLTASVATRLGKQSALSALPCPAADKSSGDIFSYISSSTLDISLNAKSCEMCIYFV